MASSAVVLLGATGLAVDVGRMYIVKNELQSFADSAALAAALRLDGTAAGLQRARDEITRNATLNKWNMGTVQPTATQTTVEFGLSPTGSMPTAWQANPAAANVSYARVTVLVNMPVYMMAAVTGNTTTGIAARAMAGQVPINGSPIGMFPFTPIAHNNGGPNFGMTAGQQYTLKWASSPMLSKGNVCGGDAAEEWIELADSRGSQNRGFYGEHASSSVIRDQVANDAPVDFFDIGDVIALQGGARTTVNDALNDRILSDPDPTSTTFSQYQRRGHTRRIITVPITDPADNNRVLGFGRFFLLVASHYAGAQGNDPWCAEYIGPGAPEGSDSTGASPSAGITRVRLVDE